MLEKFKNMGKALKEAQNMKGMMEEVQKQLEKSVVPVTELNGKVKIELTGELQVLKFEIDPSLLSPDQKATVESAIKNGFNKAIKQAKDLATNKLQSVTGGLFSGG
jgi:DNA-binding YbaB/EbfC family protein